MFYNTLSITIHVLQYTICIGVYVKHVIERAGSSQLIILYQLRSVWPPTPVSCKTHWLKGQAGKDSAA